MLVCLHEPINLCNRRAFEEKPPCILQFYMKLKQRTLSRSTPSPQQLVHGTTLKLKLAHFDHYPKMCIM